MSRPNNPLLSREQLLNLKASGNLADSGIKFGPLLADPTLMSDEQIANLLSYFSRREGYSEEYQAVLTAATTDGRTAPSSAVKTAQNTAIASMKSTITSSGKCIWDELDCIQCYLHDGAVEFGFYNWKNPSGFEASRVNSITWAANIGFTGNASNMIVNSGFNPTTHGSKFTQDSAFMGVLLAPEYGVNANVIGTYTSFGSSDGTRNLIFYYTVGAPTWAIRFNATADYVSAFNKFTQKFYAVKRDGTALTVYQGASSVSTTQASTTLVNNTIGVLGRKTVAGQDQCSSQTAHFFFAGSKYAEEGLKEILETYQAAVYQATVGTDTYLADYDFNDNTYLWKDVAKTVHPIDGEVIRAVENKNGTWGDLTATSDTTAPIYKSAVVNSLNAAEWDGVDDNLAFDVNDPDLGEQFAIFMAFKNNDAAEGSHLLSGSRYLVATGSAYPSNPASGAYFVAHLASGSAGQVTLKDKVDGWNVIALRRNGDGTYSSWNGCYQKVTTANVEALQVTDMGKKNASVTGGWEKDGPNGRAIFKDGFMTDADIEEQIAALNTAYGL